MRDFSVLLTDLEGRSVVPGPILADRRQYVRSTGIE